MKALIFLLIFGYLPLIQETEIPAGPYVELLPQSQVMIKGKSNVNSFTFAFSFEDYTSSLLLEASASQAGYKIHSIDLDIPIEKFQCNNQVLKQDFLKTLKFEEYPVIHIAIDTLMIGMMHNEMQADLKAKINIGGVEKWQDIHYQLKSFPKGQTRMSGKIKVDLNEYQLQIEKKFFGLTQLRNTVEINFLFNFVLHT